MLIRVALENEHNAYLLYHLSKGYIYARFLGPQSLGNRVLENLLTGRVHQQQITAL